MKSMQLFAAVLLTGAILSTSASEAQTYEAAVESVAADGYLETTEKVADRVWVIRQPQPFHLQPIGNVVVIEQDSGLVLVDSGGSPGSGRRIAKLVRSVSSKPVTNVVITHWHGDHSLGLAGILESWPRARVIASGPTRAALLGASMERYPKGKADSAKTAAFLKSLDDIEGFIDGQLKDAKTESDRAGYARTKRMVPVYRADVDGMYVPTTIETFEKRLTLDDPLSPVELIQPGRANTDGDTAVWLPRQKLLATGDMLVAPIPFGFGSYPADWIESLGQLRALPFTTLIPGHGAPQKDRGYLDRVIAAIQEVRAKVRPLAQAEGMKLADARKQLDFSAQRRIFVGDDPWLGTWFDQNWIGPIVGSAWKEAKGEPIEQGKG